MYTDEVKKIAKNLDDTDLVYLISEYMDINDLKKIQCKAKKDGTYIVKLKTKKNAIKEGYCTLLD